MRKPDASKACLRCGEVGRRLPECTRIPYKPLPTVRCYACVVHDVSWANDRQCWALQRKYDAIGSKSMVGVFGIGGAYRPECPTNEPRDEAIRLLRVTRFDKRAALRLVDEAVRVGEYDDDADGQAWLRRALLFRDIGDAAYDTPDVDRLRRDLEWSDWPAADVWLLYDGRQGVDPLNEEARARAWSAP